MDTLSTYVEFQLLAEAKNNVGAIWLSNNRTTSDRTKHIDIRTSFVKEYQEDGKIIIKFVKSEDSECYFPKPPKEVSLGLSIFCGIPLLAEAKE